MKGLDLSHHQGHVDFKKVKSAGYDFIIPRCGWGIDCDGEGVDSKFLSYVRDAQNAGISVPGVYHFLYLHSMSEARENAANAINNVRRAGLPQSTVIWCDQEEDTVKDAVKEGFNLTTDLQRQVTEIFCDYVLSQGYPTGVYLNRDYINRVYGSDIERKYDIWFEDHTNAEPDHKCVYRQTDWYGRVSGIVTNVDIDQYVGIYTAGTAKPKGDDKPTMKAYTEKKLVETLIALAKGNPPSDYNNSYPKNLLYWSGSRWSSDCHNLYKALFNGRSIINPQPGSFQADLSATGDCSERQLMDQCTDRSNNFKVLGKQFRCLYMPGHFGGYLGYEWEEPGQGIVNCVESTPRWEGGIQYSYVGPDGSRSWAKGKTVEGYWTEHGLASKWIDYSESPSPKPTPTPSYKEMTKDIFTGFLPMLKKGDNNDFVGLLQKCLRYTGDYTDTIDNSYGNNTYNAVCSFQKRRGLYVDGIAGKQTWTAMLS